MRKDLFIFLQINLEFQIYCMVYWNLYYNHNLLFQSLKHCQINKVKWVFNAQLQYMIHKQIIIIFNIKSMLSPRKINLLNQQKQNIDTQTSKSPQKNSYENLYAVLSNLLHHLHTLSFNIPQQILKKLPTNLQQSLNSISPKKSKAVSPVKKKVDHKQCTQIQNNLKKQLNDLRFCLKKQNEDHASQMYTLKLSHNKQLKKQKQMYSELQRLYQGQSNNMQEKVSQIRIFYDNKLKECEDLMLQNIQEKRAQLQKKYGNQRILHQEELKNLVQKHKIEQKKLQSTYQQLIATKQDDLKQAQLNYQQQKAQINKNHAQKYHKIDQLWQNRRQTWIQQNKSLKKKYEQQLITINKQKQKLYTDLYLVRKDNSNHKQTITSLQLKIVDINHKISEMVSQKEQIQKKHYRQLKVLQDKHQFYIEREYQKYQQKLAEELKNYRKCLQDNKKTIDKLNQLRQSEKSILQQRIQQLQQIYDAREPRKEDSQKIQKFQRILVKKQMQIRQLKQNYQRTLLERQNNQKNYNRIFSATTTARKHTVTNKQYPCSAQKLSKKAHTVDFSFVLKAINKNM